jgi:hypothetical protein
MAITASIALSSATATSGQNVAATLTVSNSGSSAVLVTGLSPYMVPSGGTSRALAVAVGQAPFGGPFTVSVAASGASTFVFNVVPLAPTTSYGLAEPASLAYQVGCTVYTNDGSVTDATKATLTVSNPSLS